MSAHCAAQFPGTGALGLREAGWWIQGPQNTPQWETEPRVGDGIPTGEFCHDSSPKNRDCSGGDLNPHIQILWFVLEAQDLEPKDESSRWHCLFVTQPSATLVSSISQHQGVHSAFNPHFQSHSPQTRHLLCLPPSRCLLLTGRRRRCL